jgi:hypothetical protein
MKVEVFFQGSVELEITDPVIEPYEKMFDAHECDINKEMQDNLLDYVIEEISKKHNLDTVNIDLQDIYGIDDKYDGCVLYEE